MTPSNPFTSNLVEALLSSNQALGAGNMALQLSQTTFDPRTGSGFLECNFPGYPEGGIVGDAWLNGNSPISGLPVLTLGPPAGGFRFASNETFNQSMPQQALGFRVFCADLNQPIGGSIFPTPVSFTAPGQAITLPGPTFTVNIDALN